MLFAANIQINPVFILPAYHPSGSWNGLVFKILQNIAKPLLQVEHVVTVRPWAKSVKDPTSGTQDPPLFRCSYFMGLKKKPAPVYNSTVKAANSVDLNIPVQEFRHQVHEILISLGSLAYMSTLLCAEI